MNAVRNVFPLFLLSCFFVILACEEDYDNYDDSNYGDQNLYSRAAVVGTYQAEDHTFQNGCMEKSNHTGFTGSGFMDYGGNNTMMEWGNVNVTKAGNYTLQFRYANGSKGDRRCFVTLNDTNKVGNVAFSPTGSWKTWQSASITVNLRAGNNKIRVTANTGSGGPNLDKMDVLSDEEDSVTSRCVEANEGKSATLSCPSGQVITSIDFASYGLPTGSCSEGFSTGTCHSSTSKSKVQSLCLNKPSCKISANNGTFGDPCAGKYKKLAVDYSCTGDSGGDDGGGDDDGGDGMPVFLLAGQSNVEGNVDRDLFNQLLSELGTAPAGTRQQRLEDRLTYWYQNENGGYPSYGYSAEMVALEASELIRLNGAGIVNANLTKPYGKVLCTWRDNNPAELALNCGSPFGPELVLGHVLGKTSFAPTSLIKVAKGGSTLGADWLSPKASNRVGRAVGEWYKKLSQRIESLQSNPASVHPDCAKKKCRWAGFVWFQGENDAFDEGYAQGYQQNLRDLIADVRSEIGFSSLPVVIVEIGAWAQSMDYGKQVSAAQQAVVRTDPHAKLVVTDDLSGFYHYDPAAQLIMGDRIAKTLVPMLGSTDGGDDGDDGGDDDTTGLCADADENEDAGLSCTGGLVVNSISFASYGVPTGSCSEGFSTGTCHASTSKSKVESLCLNKQSCKVGANNGAFGDPCAGKRKKLAIIYSCSSGDGGDDNGGGDFEIFPSHVGGYNGPVTSGGFVPSEYNGGYSMYVAAWSLFENYPGRKSQTGLFGTWMHTERVENPPIEKMYSDIEGGLGWWRDTRFATETPKFIMGGVALNFSLIANGPGAGAGNWKNPRGKYGVAQLSPWLLWPPDGLNIKQGASGELLGYGYLPLPLTEPKTVTAGKKVATGNHCWTLFFNTDNFKGPATFFLPYFFSRPSVDNPALSGMFLDSRLASAGGQISMETQHTPAARATTADGRTYARIAPLLFPREEDGTSIFVHNLFYYDKTALWDKVVRWFDGGSPVTGYIKSQDYYHRTFSWHSASWAIWENAYSGGDHKDLVWDNYRTYIDDDPHTAQVEWNRDLVKEVKVRGSFYNLLPEYLVLDKSTKKWKAISAHEVPDATGLKNYNFPIPDRNQEPYVTPDDPNSVWKKPGPMAGPFYAFPGDGSKITYYWYRFADQPAVLNGDMTDAERERLQKRVEKLHRNWTRDRNYLAPPTINKSLASIDPALIVQPPAGLEVGYVPIVTQQELAK